MFVKHILIAKFPNLNNILVGLLVWSRWQVTLQGYDSLWQWCHSCNNCSHWKINNAEAEPLHSSTTKYDVNAFHKITQYMIWSVPLYCRTFHLRMTSWLCSLAVYEYLDTDICILYKIQNHHAVSATNVVKFPGRSYALTATKNLSPTRLPG